MQLRSLRSPYRYLLIHILLRFYILEPILIYILEPILICILESILICILEPILICILEPIVICILESKKHKCFSPIFYTEHQSLHHKNIYISVNMSKTFNVLIDTT